MMSEILPIHKGMTVLGMARETILRYGNDIARSEMEEARAISSWEWPDIDNNLWQVTLSGQRAYASASYSMDFRSLTSSESHRYSYDLTKNVYIHESPVGTAVASNQEYIAQGMCDWLTRRPIPDAIEYDAAGKELQRQIEFDRIGGRLVVHDVLQTSDGSALYGRLMSTKDPRRAQALYEEFYDLSQRMNTEFFVGAAAVRVALELLIDSNKKSQTSSQDYSNQNRES